MAGSVDRTHSATAHFALDHVASEDLAASQHPQENPSHTTNRLPAYRSEPTARRHCRIAWNSTVRNRTRRADGNRPPTVATIGGRIRLPDAADQAIGPRAAS
ncbi:hypothetical protein NSERUTF1_1998 [Nocardia seriolae]|nr:hypothetical protein NSERUTF1_1998 [Nocardia seriolae]